MPFSPKYTITSKTASALMSIEANKEVVDHLPITPSVLESLRESARLFSTHYSTAIEGNRLTQDEVNKVINDNISFPGRERDRKEVLAYHIALEKLEEFLSLNKILDEKIIQSLHGLVMAGGRKRAKATPYRDGQNVIRDSKTNRIIYLPPEAKDVPLLMQELIEWTEASFDKKVPSPIIAGIVHYQFATIHPYYDGNGRTARLITTFILHRAGYGLKGIYSLEEYYARDLGAYYQALTVGKSHNYYEGRATASITKWVEYFCSGVAFSFEKVKIQALNASSKGEKDKTKTLRLLNPRQRKSLQVFRKKAHITSKDISLLFNISERAARNVLSAWVIEGFIEIIDSSKKSRKYFLSKDYSHLVE
jgi:Fic family protein